MIKSISYKTLKSFYQMCPMWAKTLYSLIPLHLRAGALFRHNLDVLNKTEYASQADIDCLQESQLSKVLKHSLLHVPFYKAFAQCVKTGSTPFETLAQLPFITKTDIQKQAESYISTHVSEASFWDNTGGSSGTPFAFLKNNSMYPIELSYIIKLWQRIGYHAGDPKITLRGARFSGKSPGERWAYNPIYNEIILSSYHLDDETIECSLKEISRFQPRFIHGYPSAIATFLTRIKANGWNFPSTISAVLCGSEPLYDHQRQLIFDILNCRAFSWYGQSECVLLAGECEHSSEYHSFPLYGILELIDQDGTPIYKPGIEGEIVGTSLHNVAMPFIRYRTGDRGILSENTVCKCGRSFPRLRKVTGRLQHFVYTSKGVAIPVTAFIFGQHFSAFQRIVAMQLVQSELGHIRIRLVPAATFSKADEREMCSKMESAVDQGIQVRIEYCTQLPVNSAGKTDFVIQEVTPSNF